MIRSIITRYRLDVNNTCDSKHRSFRCKNIKSNTCKICNEPQNVEHVLLKLLEKRKIFIERYSKTVKEYDAKCNREKLREILSVNSSCKEDEQSKAIGLMCNFIRSVYLITDKWLHLFASIKHVWQGQNTTQYALLFDSNTKNLIISTGYHTQNIVLRFCLHGSNSDWK